jgi:hypothetical protein
LGRERTKGRELLKLIDKFYFWAKDHYTGAVTGWIRIHAIANSLGYAEGYEDAQADMVAAILKDLDAKNPNLSNAEFQLGYAQAVAIVKGDI